MSVITLKNIGGASGGSGASTLPLLTRTPKDKNGVAINVTNYDANIPAEVTRAA